MTFQPQQNQPNSAHAPQSAGAQSVVKNQSRERRWIQMTSLTVAWQSPFEMQPAFEAACYDQTKLVGWYLGWSQRGNTFRKEPLSSSGIRVEE